MVEGITTILWSNALVVDTGRVDDQFCFGTSAENGEETRVIKPVGEAKRRNAASVFFTECCWFSSYSLLENRLLGSLKSIKPG
ncbi:hypothetical protein VTO42DRAFT_6394 [Malbranchea cinnamomea]